MYARVTSIWFPPGLSREVVTVARGLAPNLRQQQGFSGLQMLADPRAGEGIIVSLWETEPDSEASEAHSSYINQMSMMSSFLQKPLVSKTFEVNVWTT
jgi:heme-degrading monooxygenase HmoA